MSDESFSSEPYIDISEYSSSTSSLSKELKDLGDKLFKGVKYQRYIEALKNNIPFRYTLEIDKKIISIPSILKKDKDIIYNWNMLLEKKIKFRKDDFLNIYYLANSQETKNFIIEEFNKLYSFLNIETLDKISGYETIKNIKSRISNLNSKTNLDFKNLEKFYKKIEKFKTLENYSDVVDTFKINSTSSEFKIKEGNYDFNVENSLIIFNNLTLNNFFSYCRITVNNKTYYKIYNTGEKKYENFIDLNDSLPESNNKMYLFYDIKKLYTIETNYIVFDFEKSTCNINYYGTELFKIMDEMKNLIPKLHFDKKKEETNSGSFEISMENYNETKIYYLTLFSEIFSKFIFIRENSSVRSLKENLKFYFVNQEDPDKDSLKYSIYFYIKKLYLNKYIIEFKSSETDSLSIQSFILVLLKLFWYYDNLEEGEDRYLPFILNPYTGITGEGLGGKLSDYVVPENYMQTKKIDYLISKNRDIFQKRIYARNCPCPKQPIVIEKEDVNDWENYEFNGKKRNVVLFPPSKSTQEAKKNYYVCPDDEFSIFSLRENPDKTSKYPVIPCCNQTNFPEDLYRDYDKIRSNPSEYWSSKEEYKGKNVNILKTLKTLNSGRLGLLPDYVSTFLKNIENSQYIREGVFKSSLSSLCHCSIKILSELFKIKNLDLKKLKEEGLSESAKKRYEQLIKITELYNSSDLDKKEDIASNIFRSFILKILIEKTDELNIEVCSQENYDFDISETKKKLLDPQIPLESKYFYRIFEELLGINIFVFVYDKEKDISYLEYQRGKNYNIRFINTDKPSVFILNHKNRYSHNVYELIRRKKDRKINYVFDIKFSQFMKSYFDENIAYYITNINIDKQITINKNLYSNINWNIILKDYIIIDQLINTSGRCYYFNFQVSKDESDIVGIFTETAPFNKPSIDIRKQVIIPLRERKYIENIFGKKNIKGKGGLWYSINDLSLGFFIPCSDVPEDTGSIDCLPYEILRNKDKSNETLQNIEYAKYNANIFIQLVKWLFSLEKYSVSQWLKKYVKIDRNVSNEILVKNKFSVPYRFPKNIKTVDQGIDYLNNHIPQIFMKKIHLYPKLYDSLSKNLDNYVKNNEGIRIKSKEVLDNIFNDSKDFSRKSFNDVKNKDEYNVWKNDIDNDYKDLREIKEDKINLVKGYPFRKDKKFYIIQNNKNNSEIISKLTCKIYQISKTNIGYNILDSTLWKLIKEYYSLYNFGWTFEKLKSYIQTQLERKLEIKTVEDALNYLIDFDIPFTLEDDMSYIVYGKSSENKTVILEKYIFDEKIPLEIYQYSPGDYASMLPLN